MINTYNINMKKFKSTRFKPGEKTITCKAGEFNIEMSDIGNAQSIMDDLPKLESKLRSKLDV